MGKINKVKSKMTSRILLELKDIIAENFTENLIPKDNYYIYSIPEKLDVMNSVPLVKLNTVISSAGGHSSDRIFMTRERFQVQYFFADYDENDYEQAILDVEQVLQDYGFYYSTGYDSIDPDYNNLITITRQYNYRNIY